jgi:hypothetical protein
MCDLKLLTQMCGEDTPPGTRAWLYLIPAEEITTFPVTVLDATPLSTDPGAAVTLNAAFTLSTAVGKGYWRKYDILVDSGIVNVNTVGEKGALSFQNDVSFFLIGTKAEKLAFAQCLANQCLVAMIQTREDTTGLLVLGRNNDPIKVKEIKMTTGAKAGDKTGGAYMLEDSTGRVPYVYPSNLTIDIVPST